MADDPFTTAAGKRRERDSFCPHCHIDLGLHGTDDPEPDDCRYAASKADLLTSMDRLFGVRRA